MIVCLIYAVYVVIDCACANAVMCMVRVLAGMPKQHSPARLDLAETYGWREMIKGTSERVGLILSF